MNYPWLEYTPQELSQDFDKLCNQKINKKTPLPFCYAGLKVTNSFFQYEMMKTRSQNKISNYDFWQSREAQKKVRAWALKNGRDLYSTIRFFNRPPAHFPPQTAVTLYRRFNAKNVFDPFAGWGDRCLASMACDIHYTGVELNDNLSSPYTEMITSVNPIKRPEIHYMSCVDFDIENHEFDFVLTSPPFWGGIGILEEYKNTEPNYAIFLKTILIPVVIKCLAKGVWVCLYLPENMYNDLVPIVGKCKIKIPFKTRSIRGHTVYCYNTKLK
jgi:hypothetical protein